mgnify:CR=1 FL=1
MKNHREKAAKRALSGLILLILSLCLTVPGNAQEKGCWLAGDFHNHTFLTDGSIAAEDVFSHAFRFNLDWIANSEHGGAYDRNPNGQPWPSTTVTFLGAPPAGKM